MTDYVHVVPVDDLREHEIDRGTCWCSPEIEDVPDGGFVVIHNSLDRREDYETGKRKLN